jgi:DNA topoisomerase-3
VQTGQTAGQVTGFKGRSGRSFRAELALVQNEEGHWRVEFDGAWATEGAKPPESEDAAAAAAAAPAADATDAVGGAEAA